MYSCCSKLPSVFIRKADNYLPTVTFYGNQIQKAICNLDPNTGITCLVFVC